jgi:hypothetical protein
MITPAIARHMTGMARRIIRVTLRLATRDVPQTLLNDALAA